MNKFSDYIDKEAAGLGNLMMPLIEELYPICRSITGDGVRETLQIVGRTIPLELHEVSSGTQVFDWTVPKEWNIQDAYVANSRGERVIDFHESNLHVLNYSIPVNQKVSLSELSSHVYTLPDHPDWIPYRTSYYNEAWGFCMQHRKFLALAEDEYEVVIDSTLENGFLSYGEIFLPGRESEEILLTTHICHPSMCNDNLSGIAVLTALAKALSTMDCRYSYRLLFMPGTIGAITWLATNPEAVTRVRHGMVLAGVGDRGSVSYKKSRRGNAEIDRAVAQVLSSHEHQIRDFSPYGYDERQYCSPGFNLPVGRFSRSEYAQYPEYHTSADDIGFVSADSLGDSFARLIEVLQVLETNWRYRNTNPYCEPQLGKRGLYNQKGSDEVQQHLRLALLWVLNLSDGDNSLLDIAERTQMPYLTILNAAETLHGVGILEIES
jgi:aminopeptidase-like protein